MLVENLIRLFFFLNVIHGKKIDCNCDDVSSAGEKYLMLIDKL